MEFFRQSDFVRVDEVHQGETQKEVFSLKWTSASWQHVRQVKAVTYFVSDEFNKATYDSCKNVQYPETSDTVSLHKRSVWLSTSTIFQVMGLLCGSHGSKGCTEKRFANLIWSRDNTITESIMFRWFDYMGSTDNGYSPFQINYQVIWNIRVGATRVPNMFANLNIKEILISTPFSMVLEDQAITPFTIPLPTPVIRLSKWVHIF